MHTCECPPEKNNQFDGRLELSIETAITSKSHCPSCGLEGRAVQNLTVKSMLAVSHQNLLDTEYRFCTSAACEVVYFSSDGRQYYAKSQIRERVYQKEPDAEDVFVCYCFQHTRGQVVNSSPEKQAEIVASINTGIQNRQCACDTRNPQGSCCLGNVHKLIKQTQMPETKK
jgi:hypothetical protein